MNKFKNIVVLALVSSGVLVFGFFVTRSAEHHPVVVKITNDGKPQDSTLALKPPVNFEPGIESKSSNSLKEASSREIVSLYNSIDNGRAFVMKAWERPSEGGRFYASKLVDRCAGIRKLTDIVENPQPNLEKIRPEMQVKVTTATNRLFSLCGQFTEEELIKYSGASLFSNSKESDILVLLHKKVSGMSINEPSKISIVKSALDTADPMIIDDIGAKLLMDKKNGGFYLDGKNYKLKDSEEILAAYYLLPCGLGLNCSTADPMLAIACASGSTCYDNRFEKAKTEMVGGDMAKYERVLSLYEAMVSAFKNKDSSFFVQP